MTNHHNDRHQLSSQGTLRQTEMLTELKADLRRRSAQKRQRRTRLVWATAVILLAAGAWKLKLPAVAPSLVVENANSVVVETAGSQVPRYNHVTFETISDEELLAALANLGQPSVLGQIGGETTVVSQIRP